MDDPDIRRRTLTFVGGNEHLGSTLCVNTHCLWYLLEKLGLGGMQ